MASGDPVVQVIQVMPPGASAATMDARAGAATPAESVIVFDFDAAADEFMDFLCYLTGYDGGGLTFTLAWSATSATADVCRWGIGIRRFADDAEDLDTTAHSYDFNEVDATAPNATGEIGYDTIAFTDGADMDSWADGEFAIVRVTRNADHGNDNMAGDAELWAIVGKET